jgi:3-hydroxyisobutyrate dehydrogenase-like beta-hydroxyacid dehydrogenase
MRQKAGQIYVTAPVFGRPEAAAEGKLFIVAAGPRHAIEKCQPLLDAMGQKTFVIGDKPSDANREPERQFPHRRDHRKFG